MNTAKRDKALAQAFLNLLAEWPEYGGSLIRWSQRERIVAGGMLQSDLISDVRFENLKGQREGVIGRVLVNPYAIMRCSVWP